MNIDIEIILAFIAILLFVDVFLVIKLILNKARTKVKAETHDLATTKCIWEKRQRI